MTDHICATCRHLRPRGPRFTTTGKPIANDAFDFECAALEVVTTRQQGTPYEAGSIVSFVESRDLHLITEPLAIRDPERTETTEGGRVIRAGVEPFGCSLWEGKAA